MQLRDHLETLNKNKPKTVVPTLLSIKTVKFNQPILKHNPVKHNTAENSAEKADTSIVFLGDLNKEYTKYVMLGTAIAIAALIYKWYRRN